MIHPPNVNFMVAINNIDDLDPIMLERGLLVHEYLTGLVLMCTDPGSRSWMLAKKRPVVKLNPGYMETGG